MSPTAAQLSHHHRSRETARLAVLLAWVAGGVDAVGYLTLAHLFTAHMSGNSVAFATALGQAHWATVLERGAPIALFAAGIAAGTIVAAASDARGVQHSSVPVFGVEALLLVAFWLLGSGWLQDGELSPGAGWPFYALVALLTLAMGLQSATLRWVGHQSVHTTYVSGILIDLAEAIAETVFRPHGHDSAANPWGSPAQRVWLYGSVWGGYLVGAILGGTMLTQAGLTALVLPIAGLAVAIVRDLRHPHELAGHQQG
jgi:uncharacterized membrane protein YoaK (UPF0700 family)